MDKIDYAWEIAMNTHKGQKRRNGEPYIYHVKKVVRILKQKRGVTRDVIIIGILHDVLEDVTNIEELLKVLDEHFKPNIVTALHLLTHKKNEPYESYIEKMLVNKNACIVKFADIIDNLTDNPTQRQKEKYRSALIILFSGLDIKRGKVE